LISEILAFDIKISAKINQKLSNVPSTKFWKYIGKSGSQIFFPLILIFFYFGLSATLAEIISLLILIILVTGIMMMVKPLIRRKRPDVDTYNVRHYFDRYSMPSGHSTRFGFIVLFAISLYSEIFLLIILLIWSLFVIFSRVVVGNHYLLDILIGYIFGLILGLVFNITLFQGRMIEFFTRII
jgi:undecaprenyl-diphosphatase